MASEASTSNPQFLTDKKKALNEVEAKLAELNLAYGNPQIAPKKEPGTNGVQQLIDTNLYQVKVQDGVVVFRYDVTLSGTSRNDRVVELTKRTDSSCVLAGRVQECRNVFRKIMDKYHERLNWERHTVYFDLQSILYTLRPIEFRNGEDRIDLILDHDLPAGLTTATMTIKSVHEGSQVIHLSDFTALIDPITMARDRSVLNFIEMAVNQYPAHNEDEFLTLRGSTVYLMDGKKHGLPERDLGRGGTKYLASGVKKSAVLIEGQLKKDVISDGTRNIGLMLEAKHSPFYSTMNLVDNIQRHEKTSFFYEKFLNGGCNERDIVSLTWPFKKLLFDAKYRNCRPRRVELRTFSMDTARGYKINDTQTVESYFAERYDYKLRYPHAHLVIVKVAGKKIFPYPAEVLYVCDNQLVNVEQMDDVAKAQMIKECAVRPDQMKKENAAGAVAIRLRESEYTQNAGIKFTREPIGVYSRVLPPPIIGYAKNAEIQVGRVEAAWRGDRNRYKDTATNEGGFALYQIKKGVPQMNPADLDAFSSAIRRTSEKMGMNIGACKDMGAYEEHEVVDCCQYAHEHGIAFVFFVSPKNVKTCHSVMKMCEHRYGIVTQDIKVDTARKCVASGIATLENFLAKTNIKMGGLNYSVRDDNPEIQRELEETLFIGISSNQPGSKTATDKAKTTGDERPGVLGYCANMDADYNRYYGDFVYTSAYRHDYFIYLQKIMEKCVWRYKKNRGHAPPRVVFYYTGLAEGQFQNALKYGVPLMQQGISDGNDGKPIPLTVVAAQKLNNMRLLPRDFPPSGGRQPDHVYNVPHGTVVDRAVVNPVYNEFYLNAHSALVGTARSPRFNIVFDENNYSNDTVQGFTHVLAYEHQIVPRATALPTPIYVAEGYAVRGRDIFNAANNDKEMIDRLPREGGVLDIQRLSEALNYSGSTYEFLAERRVNA